MNSKDIRSLQESYLSVYEPQSLEEGLRAAAKRQILKRAAALQREDIEWIVDALVNEGYDLSSYTWDDMYEICTEELNEAEKWIQKAIKKPGALSKQLGVPEEENIPTKTLKSAAKKGGKLGKRARLAMTLKGFRKEEIDLYDTVFSHLLDEGYADTEAAAETIMEYMSEEWVDSIIEEKNENEKKKWNKGQTLKDPRAQKIYDRMTGAKQAK